MGEFADYALEECEDFSESISDFRSGLISSSEAYDMGIVNELGGEVGSERATKICRCCGLAGLSWGNHKGKWRLFEDAELHKCAVNPLK